MIAERIIIGIWVLAPVVFLLFALWAVLERSAKNKSTHPSEYVKHAAFLAGCGIIAYLIHRYMLDSLIALIPATLPRNLYLLLLWPAILFFGAKILGPSRDIMIENAPNLSRRKR